MGKWNITYRIFVGSDAMSGTSLDGQFVGFKTPAAARAYATRRFNKAYGYDWVYQLCHTWKS